MAIDKAPAYQMYARDWLGSRSVRIMEDFQRGWYIQLLNEAWDNDPQGMLPNDPELLMKLAGVTEARKSEPRFNRCWAAVADRFKVDGDWVYSERQLAQVVEQAEFRSKQAEKGKKSAAKRAAMKLLLESANHGSTAVETRLGENSESGQPEVNSPTPSPSPSPLSPPSPPLGGVGVLESVSPPSLFPGGESLSPEKEAPKKKKAVAVEKPDPWCWGDFAAVYPGFRLKPDKAAKDWLRRNVPATSEGRMTLARILVNIRGWLKSEQWIQGKVPNCSKYLDENIWQGVPGPPPRGTVQERQDGNRAALEGARRILGFDKEVPNDAG